MVQSANWQRATCNLRVAAAAWTALVDASSLACLLPPTPPVCRPVFAHSGPTINNKPFVDFGLDGGGGAGGAVTVVGGAGYRSEAWHEDQSPEPPLFQRGIADGGAGIAGGGVP